MKSGIAASAHVTTSGTAPGAPTSLAVTPGNTINVLTWVAPASNGGSAITGYLVETSANGTSGWSTVTTTGVVLTYTHTGLTNGTAYFYRVSAINAIGTSTPSSTASGTPALTLAKYRTFNGSTDVIHWTMGNLSGVGSCPQTLVAVIRNVAKTTDAEIFATSTFDPMDFFYVDGGNSIGYDDSASGFIGGPGFAAGTNWMLFAFRSVVGSSALWSRSVYSGTAWPTPTHFTPGASGVGNVTYGNRTWKSTDSIDFGNSTALVFDCVLLARFNTNLTDAQLNNMTNGIAAIQGTAGCTNLWVLGQTTPADTVGTSTLSSMTGTTLSSGTSPFPT